MTDELDYDDARDAVLTAMEREFGVDREEIDQTGLSTFTGFTTSLYEYMCENDWVQVEPVEEVSNSITAGKTEQ
jgi:hypothetical protein